MNDNLSYFSKIDNLFDRFAASSEGIIALFVNTNNASQKFMVCCRKDDTIKGLCKRIANIYYKIYCNKSGGEEDEDDYNHDKLYENIENKQIKVPYITQDYYLLPGFHRVGDLLRDYSQVTANIVEVPNSKENIISSKASPKKQRKFNEKQQKVAVQEEVNGNIDEEDSEDEEIKKNVSKKLKTERGEANIVPPVIEDNEKTEGNSSKNKKKKHNKVQEESQKPEEVSQIIEEKGESKKKKKNKGHNKKEEEKGENLLIEEEEKKKANVNKKFSAEDMKGYTTSVENKNKERKISKEVESSSEDEENEHADKKLMKGIEVIAKKEKGFNVFSSDEESSDDDKKLKKEGKSAKKGTNQPRSK